MFIYELFIGVAKFLFISNFKYMDTDFHMHLCTSLSIRATIGLVILRDKNIVLQTV